MTQSKNVPQLSESNAIRPTPSSQPKRKQPEVEASSSEKKLQNNNAKNPQTTSSNTPAAIVLATVVEDNKKGTEKQKQQEKKTDSNKKQKTSCNDEKTKKRVKPISLQLVDELESFEYAEDKTPPEILLVEDDEDEDEEDDEEDSEVEGGNEISTGKQLEKYSIDDIEKMINIRREKRKGFDFLACLATKYCTPKERERAKALGPEFAHLGEKVKPLKHAFGELYDVDKIRELSDHESEEDEIEDEFEDDEEYEDEDDEDEEEEQKENKTTTKKQ